MNLIIPISGTILVFSNELQKFVFNTLMCLVFTTIATDKKKLSTSVEENIGKTKLKPGEENCLNELKILHGGTHG